ncbi:MAG: PleD family two-component system response regulator [Spirochaetia bacterium]
MNIFIIDDDFLTIEGLSLVLEEYDTYTFTNPFQAIETARDIPPDVVITDQKMPKLSGTETIRRLREYNNKLFSIVLSGQDEPDHLEPGLVQKYVIKPYNPKDLLKTMKEITQSLGS